VQGSPCRNEAREEKPAGNTQGFFHLRSEYSFENLSEGSAKNPFFIENVNASLSKFEACYAVDAGHLWCGD